MQQPSRSVSRSTMADASHADVLAPEAALSTRDTPGLTLRRGYWGRGFCAGSATFCPHAWSEAGWTAARRGLLEDRFVERQRAIGHARDAELLSRPGLPRGAVALGILEDPVQRRCQCCGVVGLH